MSDPHTHANWGRGSPATKIERETHPVESFDFSRRTPGNETADPQEGLI